MTFVASDVVPPVFAAAKVVVGLFTGVTTQAGFGGRLCVELLE